MTSCGILLLLSTAQVGNAMSYHWGHKWSEPTLTLQCAAAHVLVGTHVVSACIPDVVVPSGVELLLPSLCRAHSCGEWLLLEPTPVALHLELSPPHCRFDGSTALPGQVCHDVVAGARFISGGPFAH